ncbi:MAG: hypothetical protein JNM94_09640 [Phycisphaerae bacterium]|nr:hypothetical protein [Phycisphaerae bacterium]
MSERRIPLLAVERFARHTVVLAAFATATSAALLPIVGCGASARAGGFDSAVPGARIDAIQTVLDDWRATHQVPSETNRMGLVESLRSSDCLVRFAAIGTLKEITGETRGYVYDDLPTNRLLAIDRWASWVTDPNAPAPTDTSEIRG